jgi:hypothetical protein
MNHRIIQIIGETDALFVEPFAWVSLTIKEVLYRVHLDG